MQLSTLGGLKLDEADFVRVKPLLLLTYVAVEGSKDRHHLAELFWPDAANPLNSLAAALTQLRQYAPGAIEIDLARVSSAVECDATTFLKVVDASYHEQALGLYRGPFLSGVYLPGWSAELEEWVYGTREFLAGRARSALLRSGEDIAVNGRFEEAAKYAETAYLLPGAPELEPEELKRVFALLVAGNSPHLARLRKDAQGYGVEFSLSHVEAREQLRRPLSGSGSPRLKQTLPTRGTSFIGRNIELAEIASRLEKPDCSLLTLTGSGGVGKSRLAMRVGHDLSERYLDGVYFIPLEALSDTNLVPLSIAEALSLSLQGSEDPLVQVIHHIGDKGMLLMLDNFEHLIAGVTLVAQFLRACPNLKLLVTSRERLNLEEEWVLPLEGLEVPTAELSPAEASHHDAIKLFSERAKRARLSFELTPQDLPHVVSICNRVQGLPLGIELAAAWVKMLSCQEIAQEIGRTTDFLFATSRNVPERHRSIRTVFEGSWRLLTPKEQGVLRKLSVFQGGFKREAAADVAGATIPVLASLVDKSLLRPEADGRYDCHPLLYQYSREKLADCQVEEAATCERHAKYFLSFAEEAETQFNSGKQVVAWLQLLEMEQANLREALRFTKELSKMEMHIRLAGALAWFWWQRGYLGEGRRWLEGAIQSSVSKTISRAKALNGAGLIAWAQSSYMCARTYQEENLSIRRALRDQSGTAVALNNSGIVAYDECDFSTARSLHSEALAIWRELGHQRGIAFSLTNLGLAVFSEGDHPNAHSLQSESLALMRELEDEYGVALALINLGDVVCEQGDYTLAQTLHEESIDLFSRMGNQRGIAFSLESFASLAVGQGEAERAARLWGAAEAIREEFSMPMPVSKRSCYTRDIADANSQLEGSAFIAAWRKGREMSVAEAVAYAIGKGSVEII